MDNKSGQHFKKLHWKEHVFYQGRPEDPVKICRRQWRDNFRKIRTVVNASAVFESTAGGKINELINQFVTRIIFLNICIMRLAHLKKSWWNCVANEVNKHPRAVMRPPMTAVTLVDFRRQKAMVTGDMRRATPVDIAPSHPVKIQV